MLVQSYLIYRAPRNPRRDDLTHRVIPAKAGTSVFRV
jgi:hypothetical protein